MTIYNQKQIDEIISVAGKWYDPKTATIRRKMKDVTKLTEYADKIAQFYFIPNALDGRGEYQGRHEYRKHVDVLNTRSGEYKERVTEHYYAIISDSRTGKDTPAIGAATIIKDGNFWYYVLTGIKIHHKKPMLF